MRLLVILVVVVAQLAVLAFMAGEREWVLRTGDKVLLRTAPVDPRDVMRGDYVRFRYEIATVPKRLCRDGVIPWFKARPQDRLKVRDRVVYATLQLDRDRLAELTSLSDQPPASGPYLRGRVLGLNGHGVEVRFGVEALFLQQGRAAALEKSMREEKPGVPIDVELAVGRNGLAVLKGYQWEPLGITVTLEQAPAAANGSRARRPLRAAVVELKNHGRAPVAVVDGPGLATLRLVAAEEPQVWADEMGSDNPVPAWVPAREPAATAKPTAENIKVLQPGEVHRLRVDFTSPEWFVERVGQDADRKPPASIADLDQEWSARFRFEYVPPSMDDCTGLPGAELIRHSRLRSRAFSAAGSSD